MCGRYSLAIPDANQLRARFPVGESVTAGVGPRFNIAPGDQIIAVTSDREGAPRGELLRWGLVPGWAKDTSVGYKMINARAETLAERPAFRSALERYRCLIPAGGFYEWQTRTGAPKQPFHITRADGQLFAFAGLWAVWHRGAPDTVRSATIVTTAANELMAPIHGRMPVILNPDEEAAWLDPATPAPMVRELLHGLTAHQLSARPVSTAVNDARFDGPECLDDPLPAPAPAQGKLFG